MFSPTQNKLPLAAGIAVGGMMLGFFIGRAWPTNEPAARPDSKSSAPSVTRRVADRQAEPRQSISIPTGDAPSVSLDEQWRAFWERPVTPETEDQMRACLKELGARDFAAALVLAQEAPIARQRELFRNAALQGWSTIDASAAATWVLSHVRSQERRAAVEAIAAGAVAKPAEAIGAFQQLIAADPLLASDHGNALISAFAYVGQFEVASEFAAAGLEPYRAAWLSNVYHAWAVSQPEAALTNLDKLPDPAERSAALSALFAGWGSSDPATLVSYAQNLPKGDSRFEALREGLTQWVYRDPSAASAWMDKFDPSPDLDAGAAAFAVMPALVQRKPDVAASWAESITDPEMRANTLLDLIRLWAEHDAAGAQRYANTSPALDPSTRSLALATLQPSP